LKIDEYLMSTPTTDERAGIHGTAEKYFFTATGPIRDGRG